LLLDPPSGRSLGTGGRRCGRLLLRKVFEGCRGLQKKRLLVREICELLGKLDFLLIPRKNWGKMLQAGRPVDAILKD
jgi:hypothetical protein